MRTGVYGQCEEVCIPRLPKIGLSGDEINSELCSSRHGALPTSLNQAKPRAQLPTPLVGAMQLALAHALQAQ